jgi:hypothetical protein
MPLNAPFHLGPFLVDIHGRLTPRSLEATPGFMVRWRGRPVHARVEQQGDDDHLTLRAVVGRIPSTAGKSGGSKVRPRSFDTLRDLRRELPDGWRLRLLPDHSAVMKTDAAVALPVTAVELVTALTRFLLKLTPYHDLLDETGLPAGRA